MTSTAVDSVTTGPIEGSVKHYREVDGLRIPVRRIGLTTGDHFDVYDTSGPYTDDAATIDLEAGLPALRDGWEKPDIPGPRTQLAWARAGEITAEMRFIAAREGVEPELVRAEVAAGRAVIPANHRHPELEPTVIGKKFLVKINANIGNSAVSSSIAEEVETIARALLKNAPVVLLDEATSALDP
ncbi:phosphomethylpyrimidine synthase ThiC, partial [Nocardia sp. NPDC003345]